MANYSTGWYGIPGRTGGQVHLLKDGRALCGSRVHPQAEFFCNARHIVYEWIECKRCRERAWPMHLNELVVGYECQLKENANKAYLPQYLRDSEAKHIKRQLSAIQSMIAKGNQNV